MNDSEIQKMIERHEGRREKVYKDTVGVLTVGIGHALHEGSEVPREVVDILFEIDYNEAVEGYDFFVLDLDPVRRAVVIDMIFNMGAGGVSKFKKMLYALRHKDYDKAAAEMMNSKWYYQVGNRGIELVGMMRTGEVT